MCEGCQIKPTEQQASSLSRRRMLGVTAAGVAGAAALTAFGAGTAAAGAAPATPAGHHGGGGSGARRIPVDQISIQLYTLRDLMAADLEGTLAKLARIGFKKVEHAGVPAGLTAKQFRKLLDRLGLRSTSGHNDIAPIAAPFDSARRAAWQAVLDTANTLGQKSVNLSVVGASFTGGLSFFDTAEQWKALCDVLNQAGRMARASGLSLGLHNHFWEFLPLLDSHLVGSDFLISETDPRYVHFEIDLYWAHYAHHDPVQIISYIQDRVTQFHVKDMKVTPGAPGDTGPAMTFTDPGAGVIDFRRIFASKTASPRNTEYIIERDDAGQGALTTAQVGFDFLKNIRF